MTDVIARGGIEVYGDTSSFEAAMARAEAAAQRFEAGATQSAGKASASVSGVGKDAARGVADLDAATRRAIDSLQLMTAKAQLSPAAFQLFKAEMKGLNADAIAPYAVALGKATEHQAALASVAAKTAGGLNLVGISAGQATQAMRQLPAQITDVVTGLASGQSAMTVLIQQGGQLKDSFGGVGNVFRALGTILTPVRLLIGGVAGALVTLGLAYRQGAAEADEYRRALVLTGNAAGATVGQLQAAAENVSRTVGTQGKAAEVIAQLAASGRVAAGDMETLTEAAIRLEREGGPAVRDTVKAFADLGKDPTKAAARLNESVNFLTIDIYKQIKALEEQGRVADAAAVAQAAYADTVTQRAKKLEDGLGTLQKAWRAVGDFAKSAWDKMLGIGRQESPEAELARLTEKLRTAEAAPEGLRSADRQQFIEYARSRIEALRLLVNHTQEAAAADADRAQKTQAAIKADDAATKSAKSHADELKRLIDHGKQLVDGLDLEKAGFSPSFLRDMQALQAYAKSAGLSVGDLQSAIQKLLDKQPFATAAAKAEAEAQKAVADAIGKAVVEREKELAELSKLADAQSKHVQSLDDELYALQHGQEALQERVALRKQEQVALLETDAVRALVERGDAREYEAIRARASALQSEIDLIRKISSEKTKQANTEAARKAALEAQREWEKTAESLRESLTDAFRRAFESGEDFGTAMVKVIEREIKARIATALAGLLADSVLGLVGIQAKGSAASSLYQLSSGQGLLGGLLGSLASSPAAYGAAIGTTSIGAGSQAAMLAAQTGEFGAAGLAATSGAAAGAGAGFAATATAAAPYVAAAIAAYQLLGTQSTPHTGGYALAGPSGVQDITAVQGGIANAESQKAVESFASGIAGALNNVAKAFGQDLGLSVRAVFESDNNDPSWGLFQVLNRAGAQVGGFDALGTLPASAAEGFKAYADRAAQSIIDALQQVDVPGWASDMLAAIGDTPGVDQLISTLDAIASKAKQIASERESIQAQIDLLDGTTTARDRERVAIDESNRALYDRLNALQVEGEKEKLRIDILRAKGDESGAVALERADILDALAKSGRDVDGSLGDLYLTLWDVQDAAQAATASVKQVGNSLANITPGGGWLGGSIVNPLAGRSVTDPAALAKILGSQEFATRELKYLEDKLGTTVDKADPDLVKYYRSVYGGIGTGGAVLQVMLDELAKREAQPKDARDNGAQEFAATVANSSAMLAESMTKLRETLTDYLSSLTQGSLSILSPEQKYLEAKAAFDNVSRQAMAGDQASIEQLRARAETLLTASRSVNASGAGYVSDFQAVVAALQKSNELLSRVAGSSESTAQTSAFGFGELTTATREGNSLTREASQSSRAADLLYAQRWVE